MFDDREDAGRQLAEVLRDLRGEQVVVLGLPRGGVPVAAVVADSLGAALDLIVVRKLGAPLQPELAMGAIGEDDVRVLNHAVLREFEVSEDLLERIEVREREELDRQVRTFRTGPPVTLEGKTAVIVDDGVATGATATAAIRVARKRGAHRVVLAAPVMGAHAAAELAEVSDQVVYLDDLSGYSSVSQGYYDFRPVSEARVIELMNGREA